MGKKWYQKTWVIILFLFIFAPIGIVLLWINKKFTIKTRKIASSIFAVYFIVLLVGSSLIGNDSTQVVNDATPTPEPQVESTIKPTEEPLVESPTPDSIEMTEEQEEEKTKDSLSEEEIADTVKDLITDYVGIDDTLDSVTLSNGQLAIAITLSTDIPENFTIADMASSNTLSVTDLILEHIELDQYWEYLCILFGDYGEITLTKDEIVDDNGTRYFEVDYTDFQ